MTTAPRFAAIDCGTNSIRLLIADDQAMVRGALAALLDLENDLEVVGQVGRGDEVVDACLHLIKSPDARDDTLMAIMPGPDFPTGGVLVESPETLREAYRTGRGSLRLRARWHREDMGRGQWQVIVTEIPYQVQKSKLIERLAEVIQLKKVPILADVRDESAEDVRIVLEPRARSVDPEQLMAALFRVSELEVRFGLNMNVLIDGRVPKVCSLKEVLRAFLDHRRDVLQRCVERTRAAGRLAAERGAIAEVRAATVQAATAAAAAITPSLSSGLACCVTLKRWRTSSSRRQIAWGTALEKYCAPWLPPKTTR